MQGAGAARGAAGGGGGAGGGAGMFGVMMRAFAIYAIMKLWMGEGPGRGGPRDGVPPNEAAAKAPPAKAPSLLSMMGMAESKPVPKFHTIGPTGLKRTQHRPLWRRGQAFRMQMYLSFNESLDLQAEELDSYVVHSWAEGGLVHDAAADLRSSGVELTVDERLLQRFAANETLFAHCYLQKEDAPWPPVDAGAVDVSYQRFNVSSRHFEKKKATKRRLLDEGEQGEAASPGAAAAAGGEEEGGQWVTAMLPSVNLRVAQLFQAFPLNGVPPNIVHAMEFDAVSAAYKPVLYQDSFWILTKHRTAVNETLLGTALALELTFDSIGMWRWMLQSQMQETWDRQEAMGMSSAAEQDGLRTILMDTNPWLLGLTSVVTLLHMVFEWLAFRSEVGFWRKKKTATGVSLRSFSVSIVSRVIIFLYLLDAEDTSWMILFEHGLGVAMLLWKLHRLLSMKLERREGAWLPSLRIEAEESYNTSGTAKYDAEAVNHLLYIVVPMVAGLSAYNLKFNEYKSYYSWIIGSLVSYVYLAGFVWMVPQLWVNQRLRSVAHMNSNALVYKAINTFIDDLYAFIVKVPLMHRLACFRDDIIFVVWIFQRFSFDVDKTRVNEFGGGGDDGGAPQAPGRRGKRERVGSGDEGGVAEAPAPAVDLD